MMPKIYCFTTSATGGQGQAYAIAEDGTILATHWCSEEFYVPNDLGVTPGGMGTSKHRLYEMHYPEGYDMEFVSVRDSRHEGLRVALDILNRK
jgi:hypothetical protein